MITEANRQLTVIPGKSGMTVNLPPLGMIANSYGRFFMPGRDKNCYPVTRFLRLVI